MGKYYHRDQQAHSVLAPLLKEAISQEYPKPAEKLHVVIDNSLELDASVNNVIHLALQQKLQRVSFQLSQAFASQRDKDIEMYLEEYEQLMAGELTADDNSEVIQGANIVEIMEKRSDANRIPVLPPSLTKQLEGGPIRGHHIVLYAVTDLGKTLFTLNMIRGFIRAGLKVVYVCNEDPMADLVERILTSICSAKGKDKHDIRKYPKQAAIMASKLGWDNLVWAELSPGTLGEIRAIVDEYKPDVLVVDQIRNLDTGEKNYVRSLEIAAQAMRNFAKKYNLLSVSVTQAADSANGRAILGRGDIDNSNVGIPGTADLMLGIGATEDQELQGQRVLSFAKNKVSGDKSPLPVFFNQQTMRVE